MFQEIAALGGDDNLYFYDAIAAQVTFNSLNQNKIFKASRYVRAVMIITTVPSTGRSMKNSGKS
jgi:folate-dependent tRNA-U54 methylase TrmFO/GidA